MEVSDSLSPRVIKGAHLQVRVKIRRSLSLTVHQADKECRFSCRRYDGGRASAMIVTPSVCASGSQSLSPLESGHHDDDDVLTE